LDAVCLKGKVFSGKGEGTEFLNLPWVRKQIEEKLGFIPYEGTLNVKLHKDSVNLRRMLTSASGIEILPQPGFCHGRLFKACLMGTVVCAVVVPGVSGYPEDVIELVASVNLREKLQLLDGDLVNVKIML
jgi:riboflavin kinase